MRDADNTLKRIAKALERIAAALERMPGVIASGDDDVVNIVEGDSDRTMITTSGASAQYVGRDGNNLNGSTVTADQIIAAHDVGDDVNSVGNDLSIEHYHSHGERGTTAKNINLLDNSARSGGDNAGNNINRADNDMTIER